MKLPGKNCLFLFTHNTGVSKEMLEEEIEFWQLPDDVEVTLQEEKLGNKLAITALEVLRKKVRAVSD